MDELLTKQDKNKLNSIELVTQRCLIGHFFLFANKMIVIFMGIFSSF